jgi:hypothetical protein
VAARTQRALQAGLRRCGGEEGADATAWRHDGGCRAPHLAAVAASDGPAWQRLMPFAQLRCQSLLLLLKCGFKLAFNAPIAPVAELASNSATHSLAGAVAAAGEAAVRDHRQVVNCDGATVSPKKPVRQSQRHRGNHSQTPDTKSFCSAKPSSILGLILLSTRLT